MVRVSPTPVSTTLSHRYPDSLLPVTQIPAYMSPLNRAHTKGVSVNPGTGDQQAWGLAPDSTERCVSSNPPDYWVTSRCAWVLASWKKIWHGKRGNQVKILLNVCFQSHFTVLFFLFSLFFVPSSFLLHPFSATIIELKDGYKWVYMI